MKHTLELDIAECQKRYEDQQKSEEEKLRQAYEAELTRIEQKHDQLRESFQAQEIQLRDEQEAHTISRKQYEEQLERLNKK